MLKFTCSASFQYALLFLCMVSASFFGLILFNQGYFLSREELPLHSTCQDFPLQNKSTSKHSNPEKPKCWTEPKYDKIVIILIDALRYDFTLYNDSKKDDALPYENKFPIFSKMLKQKKKNSLLFKFLADAPTTTMQRLKGLTSGSLPTFIDASNNFARYLIFLFIYKKV